MQQIFRGTVPKIAALLCVRACIELELRVLLPVLLDRDCCDHFCVINYIASQQYLSALDLINTNDLGWVLFGMMAVQEENDFQPVIDRFEDDVLALAYYIKDRDVICGEYTFA